jgi:hypothetical protein
MARFSKCLCAAGLLLAGVAGCRKDELRDPCLQPTNVAVRLALKQVRDTLRVDTGLAKAILIPLGGKTALQFGNGATTLSAYLSPQSDFCQYLFTADSFATVPDTLSFSYSRKITFLSNACGFTTFFTLSRATATGNAIDSFLLVNPLVNNDANSPAHLLLYLRRRP